MRLKPFICVAGIFIVTLFSSAVKTGERRILVLPIEYKDCIFTVSDEQLESLADSSMLYFSEQLPDEFIYEFAPKCKLPNPYAYYGANGTASKDVNFYEAVIHTCRAVDAKVDFSKWDYLLFLSAGLSEADGFPSDCIWPRCSKLGTSSIVLDGKKIDKYAVTCELAPDGHNRAGIGDFCHETGHLLGLVDLYDVLGGDAKGLGTLSLMGSGNRLDRGRSPSMLSAVDLEQMDMSSDKLQKGHYTLQPRSRQGLVCRMDADVKDEYFLFECRKAEAWDEFIDKGGLIVYHVDKSDNDSGYSTYLQRALSAKERWTYGEVNCNPAHECALVLEPGVNFTSCTEPAFQCWSGRASSLAVTGVRVGADGSVDFDIDEPVEIESVSAYQDAVTLKWHTGWNLSSCRIEWNDDGPRSEQLAVSPDGKYCCTIESLSPGTEYDYSVFIAREDGLEFRFDGSFTTLAQRLISYPFIYFWGVERLEDGSFKSGTGFPLRVFNPVQDSKVVWYFDGKEINSGRDGIFVPDHSGVLRAVITKTDGGREILQKTITLK